jgi:hypothetical protein
MKTPMTFTKGADINGTGLQGKIVTTYDKLVAVFGEPDERNGDKTTVEWHLRFEDGTVASIYDWKYGTTPMAEAVWNVGGKTVNAYYRVLAHLEEVLV